MKISGVFLALLSLFSASTSAHTMGTVKFTCPIDETAFEAVQDFSGTSFGARLDLKKTGPIAQPWKLAQCPKCHLPLYKEKFDPAELAKLRQVVTGEKFVRETKNATAYFTLGVIQEELHESPFEIAWTFLAASWEVESDKDQYASACKRSVAWFDQAVAALENKKDKRNDYLMAKYLPIELSRRRGDFSDATRRLKAFPTTTGTEIEWLDDTLKFQATLIKNKDAAPHEISEAGALKR